MIFLQPIKITIIHNNSIIKTVYLILIINLFSCNSKKEESKCSKDELISIAEKEWLNVYGKGIYSKKPFVLSQKNDSICVVSGTLPPDFDGGVPSAEINSKSCKIISISHGK